MSGIIQSFNSRQSWGLLGTATAGIGLGFYVAKEIRKRIPSPLDESIQLQRRQPEMQAGRAEGQQVANYGVAEHEYAVAAYEHVDEEDEGEGNNEGQPIMDQLEDSAPKRRPTALIGMGALTCAGLAIFALGKQKNTSQEIQNFTKNQPELCKAGAVFVASTAASATLNWGIGTSGAVGMAVAGLGIWKACKTENLIQHSFTSLVFGSISYFAWEHTTTKMRTNLAVLAIGAALPALASHSLTNPSITTTKPKAPTNFIPKLFVDL